MKRVARWAWLVRAWAGLGGIALVAPVAGGGETIVPDLQAVARGEGTQSTPGLMLEWVADAQGRPALRLQSGERSGLVRLGGVELGNGTIELDILGQSAPVQCCFLGVAFRVTDEESDIVYFRPFNFRAEDPQRRAHAVQYVSHPAWTWQRLRSERTGQYEKPIDPPPDGDRWFHARVVIRKPTVSVYVDGETEPSLVVNELSDRTGGGVGLWVGPGLGGHFANLAVRPEP